MIELRVDPRNGLPVYRQITHQVRDALRLGMLLPGDRMPTVRDLVATLAINPNTVMKAYRDLEREGLIGGRPGQGTFVLNGIVGSSPDDLDEMRTSLEAWLGRAKELGMDDESIGALIATTLRRSRDGNGGEMA